jgi:hypothetical protein
MNFSECELNALQVSVCLVYMCGFEKSPGYMLWRWFLDPVPRVGLLCQLHMPVASLLGNQQFTLTA